MSLQEINQLVKNAYTALYNNEKFATSVLAVKAKKVAELYPNDPTVVGMFNFLSKRADTEPLISRADLKNIYNKLHTYSNKFAESFVNELGVTEHKRKVSPLFQRDENEGVALNADVVTDPVLSNALASVFDNSVPLRLYSPSSAKSAEESCSQELSVLGLAPKSIKVVAGQEDVLICQASYETPKGESNVLIPVEIKNDKALFPSYFLSRGGFITINKDNLEGHIHATAGRSFKVDVQGLLKSVAQIKNPGSIPSSLGDVERLMMKVNAKRETPGNYTPNGILYQEVDKIVPDIKVEYEQPEEVKSIAKMLTSSAGVAEMQFGKNAVEKGRLAIISEMDSFGYKYVQAVVDSSTEDMVLYAVSVDGEKGFKVPVKFKNSLPLLPSVVVVNGSLNEFTKRGISKILAGNADISAVAKNSSLYVLPSADIIDIVRKSSALGYLKRAEEGLLVLNELGDEYAYRTAYNIYASALSGQREKLSKCARQITSKTSKYLICGHTNLPIHKVYQDKYGDCHPLSGRNTTPTDNSVSLFSHQVQ